MKTAEYCFKVADIADKCGGFLFYVVFITSMVLAKWDTPQTDAWCHPILIVAVVLAVIATIVTSIYQTEGNATLRETQLTDGLGGGAGEEIRPDYYNNNVPPSLRRLAATTLENTLFTKEVLSMMCVKMRFKVGIFLILLLILFTSRTTPTSWLVVVAQTLFSTDLAIKLIWLERFRIRTARVHKRLADFFQLATDCTKPNEVAILMSAFTDYECAKDEAACPLESKYFIKLNPELSRQWTALKARLKLE